MRVHMDLDKTLSDIKRHISLKNTTRPDDIVIVCTPDGIVYGVVRDINPDIKKNWYSVQFTLLVLPPLELCWTLRQPQMCGEIFTINGKEHFMAAVELGPGAADTAAGSKECGMPADQPGRVLQLVNKNDEKDTI